MTDGDEQERQDMDRKEKEEEEKRLGCFVNIPGPPSLPSCAYIDLVPPSLDSTPFSC